MTTWTHRIAAVAMALGVAAPAQALSTIESFKARSNFMRSNTISRRIGPESLNRGTTISPQRSKPAATFPVQTDVVGFDRPASSTNNAGTKPANDAPSVAKPRLGQTADAEDVEIADEAENETETTSTETETAEPTVINNYMLIVPFHHFADKIAVGSGWSVTVNASYHYTPTPMPAQTAGNLANVTATPIPPALATSVVALAALGAIGRRRRKIA